MNTKKMRFHIADAYTLYSRYILNGELQALLQEFNLHVAGSVPAVLWELFGAVLTGDKGKRGYGSDLNKHEIKSAVEKASFEYQYHLKGGRDKLMEDMNVSHVYISYSKDYRDVDVRILSGATLKGYFMSWLPKLRENYSGPNRKQRYRKNIPFGYVKINGQLVMRIRDGELVDLE